MLTTWKIEIAYKYGKQKIYEKELEDYSKATVLLLHFIECLAIALVWIRYLRNVCIEICWIIDDFYSICNVSACGIFNIWWNKSNRLPGDNGGKSIWKKRSARNVRWYMSVRQVLLSDEYGSKTSKNSRDSIREIRN